MQLPLDYVVEPRPGLSWARNRAIDEADTEVIAWVDDDEECDPWWVSELSRGFVEHPESDAVSGMVVPAELATPAQWWFEAYGGHSKSPRVHARDLLPGHVGAAEPAVPAAARSGSAPTWPFARPPSSASGASTARSGRAR